MLRDDEEELFREFHPRRLHAVHTSKGAPSADLVEEACMFAWKQFLRYQPDRDREWRHWLITTAQRELWRIARLERDHDSVERTITGGLLIRAGGSDCRPSRSDRASHATS